MKGTGMAAGLLPVLLPIGRSVVTLWRRLLRHIASGLSHSCSPPRLNSTLIYGMKLEITSMFSIFFYYTHNEVYCR